MPAIGLLWFLEGSKEFPLPFVVHHTGDGGQRLYLFPNHNIVVARLRIGAANDTQSMNNLVQLAADALIHRQR